MAVHTDLVDVTWLKEQLDQGRPDLLILDASYDFNRNVEKDFLTGHIPGALFFDIKQCRDMKLPYPNMMPPPQTFAHFVGQLGVDNNMHIVVYDNNCRGLFGATRVWWMFRVFGHDRISVLNGGLQAWKLQKYPLSSERIFRSSKTFHATARPGYVTSYEEILKHMKAHGLSSSPQIVDMRPPTLYTAGHLPKAKNLPYFALYNDLPLTTLKDAESLEKAWTSSALDVDQPMIFYCNTGIASCMGFFVAHLLGKKPPDISVYDGSWCEWDPRAKGHHGYIEYAA